MDDPSLECPPDVEEKAEAYCLNLLSPEDAHRFEDHYITCAQCAEVVVRTDRYVRAMQAAAREQRAKVQSAERT